MDLDRPRRERGADKGQVSRMVEALLGLDVPLKPVDAADAVAVALCHLAMMTASPRSATGVAS